MTKIPRSSKKALRKVLREQQGPGVPDFSLMSDPRCARGKRHFFEPILRILFAAMLIAIRSLRSVATFSARRGLSISYSAMYALLSRLKSDHFRQALRAQVSALYQAKALEPSGFPCHIIAIDGKSLYYGVRKLNKFCQKTTHEKTGKTCYHLRIQRAVLVSSPLKTILDQRPIPAHQSEMSAFADFIAELKTAYRWLFAKPLISADAGMVSFVNAKLLNDSGFGFVLALKNNQPELLATAKTALSQEKAEFVSDWELYKGHKRRVKLFRTFELQGWPTCEHDWDFLRQVWLVQTEVQMPKGRSKPGRRKNGAKKLYHPTKIVEERYFLSNVLVNYLKPAQSVAVVRGHWGVENDANWTCDVIYYEDESPWCRKGEALLTLSLMRAMSINMLNWLWQRHIRNEWMKKWSWSEWLAWLHERMVLDLDLSEGEHKAAG